MRLLVFLICFILCCNNFQAKGLNIMDILTTAPDFTLLDQDSKAITLSDYAKQYVLIYFYPKDDTPGCTKEACLIRDSYSGFAERKIQVLGISADSPASHKKFMEKYHLPFTLLADEKKTVAKLYHADGFFIKRISYLISPGGHIAKFYPNVDPASHAQVILDDFDKLNPAI